MNTTSLIPQLGGGRGRLIRVGNTVMYSAGDAASASALIGWCKVSGTRPPGELLGELQRLADGAASLGPFCAVVVDGARWHVVSANGVPLTATDAAGTRAIASDGTLSTLDQPSSLDLLIGSTPIDPLLTLNDGVVAADGFSLRVTTTAALPWEASGHELAPSAPEPVESSAAAEAAPIERVPVVPVLVEPAPVEPVPVEPVPVEPAPVEPAPVASPPHEHISDDMIPVLQDTSGSAPQPAAAESAVLISLSEPSSSADPLPVLTPLPVATPEAAAPNPVENPGPTPVLVKGLVCSRGHFNDPRARFCSVCGIAMHQTSFILTDGPRPSLGVLVMSDGAYHTLVTSLVFGRDPSDDVEVRAGRAQGVTLVDPGNTISRVHAEIRAVDWDVFIVDRGSTNGTFIWSAEQQQWLRLSVDQPVLLSPGSHVSFGRLTGTFESGAQQKG